MVANFWSVLCSKSILGIQHQIGKWYLCLHFSFRFFVNSSLKFYVIHYQNKIICVLFLFYFFYEIIIILIRGKYWDWQWHLLIKCLFKCNLKFKLKYKNQMVFILSGHFFLVLHPNNVSALTISSNIFFFKIASFQEQFSCLPTQIISIITNHLDIIVCTAVCTNCQIFHVVKM